ncbi:MAG TPA: hypothetical protein VFC19_29580 [Candidatus Limnocylindrales bacterium]|nr:hypothetical protein [Candidatus Limnocylindrales bacterium]
MHHRRRHTIQTRQHNDDRSDRGAATVEVAGNLALMLLTVSVGAQVAAWGLAALGAHYSANQAANTARLHGSSATAGQDNGYTMLNSAVGTALRDPTVTVTRNATTVTATVTGRAASIIPGISPPVTVTVHVPVERVG